MQVAANVFGSSNKNLQIVLHDVEWDGLFKGLLKMIIADVEKQEIVLPEGSKQHFAFSAMTPDGKIAGCINGYTFWNELRVELLSVNPDCKVPRTGTVLMQHVEKLARSHGSEVIWLDTYSFQARPFYEKLGFTMIASQDNLPAGHTRYFMQKWLAKEDAGGDACALSSQQRAIEGLKVVETDYEVADRYLNDWLDVHTDAAASDVPHYRKTSSGLEVTLEDGTFVGGCAYETVWNEMHLSLLCVKPEFSGYGVASRILAELEVIAKKRGCCRISLDIMSWQAKLLYEKNGFTQFGVQEGIPRGYARYHMEKCWY